GRGGARGPDGRGRVRGVRLGRGGRLRPLEATSIAPKAVDELVRPHQAELPAGQALEVEVVGAQPPNLVPQARVALHEHERRLPDRPPLRAQAEQVRDPVLPEQDRGGDARDRESERRAQHLPAPDAHRASGNRKPAARQTSAGEQQRRTLCYSLVCGRRNDILRGSDTRFSLGDRIQKIFPKRRSSLDSLPESLLYSAWLWRQSGGDSRLVDGAVRERFSFSNRR